MKKLKLVLKSKFIIFSILILMSKNCYSSNILNYNENTIGPLVLKDYNLVVTGDSFAGKFCEFEKDRELEIIPYARAGMTIDQNQLIMALALNFEENNYLISIGVNDLFYETPPYIFESVLRKILNVAVFNQKKVYMHSYLKYFSDLYYKKRYQAQNYDSIIRKLCMEYDIAEYIDVSDLESLYYISDDNMHYNKYFYDELYNRLFKKLYEFENIEYKQN